MEVPCHYGVENEVSIGNRDNITDMTLRLLPVLRRHTLEVSRLQRIEGHFSTRCLR